MYRCCGWAAPEGWSLHKGRRFVKRQEREVESQRVPPSLWTGLSKTESLAQSRRASCVSAQLTYMAQHRRLRNQFSIYVCLRFPRRDDTHCPIGIGDGAVKTGSPWLRWWTDWRGRKSGPHNAPWGVPSVPRLLSIYDNSNVEESPYFPSLDFEALLKKAWLL